MIVYGQPTIECMVRLARCSCGRAESSTDRASCGAKHGLQPMVCTVQSVFIYNVLNGTNHGQSSSLCISVGKLASTDCDLYSAIHFLGPWFVLHIFGGDGFHCAIRGLRPFSLYKSPSEWLNVQRGRGAKFQQRWFVLYKPWSKIVFWECIPLVRYLFYGCT